MDTDEYIRTVLIKRKDTVRINYYKFAKTYTDE